MPPKRNSMLQRMLKNRIDVELAAPTALTKALTFGDLPDFKPQSPN